jgi:hypothetical protein
MKHFEGIVIVITGSSMAESLQAELTGTGTYVVTWAFIKVRW